MVSFIKKRLPAKRTGSRSTNCLCSLNGNITNIYRGFSFYKYGTVEYVESTVTEDGWYYARTSTGNTKAVPFVRFGIKNGYIYESTAKISESYQYITSPIVYMKSGDMMIAQGSDGVENSGMSVFFKKDA